MNQQKQKRSRGLIFTDRGLQKLQSVICFENKYTYEELSEKTGLAYNTVFKVLKRHQGVDKRTLVKFFMTFNLELTASDYTLANLSLNHSKKLDRQVKKWNTTVDLSNFYGRNTELLKLKQWLVKDRCRLVTLYGMGGVGKTSLSIKLINQIKEEFDCVVFISLKEFLLFEEFLSKLLQAFIGNNKSLFINSSKNIKDCFLDLIDYLRQHRCLIVLDDVEATMQVENYCGCYQETYKEFGHLIKNIGEIEHHSCFLLISRELPCEAAILEGNTLPIRCFKLKGLKEHEARKIFREKEIFGTITEENFVIKSYSGNPFALKTIALTIKNDHSGNFSNFLQQEYILCSEIEELLSQQYKRLSPLEKAICKNLSNFNKSLSVLQIQKNFLFLATFTETMICLESLFKRSLVVNKMGLFSCEPVFDKYLNS
ncbi:NB-ARC domain-containing protein [Myxosarcina sp. GI1]|uniref:NB-ARC domain-containing protein n=1 Tax=Myxosarcina sp. GI1 TaxID=1541065 RepID=UPI00068EAA98|nr:NB-ARC domain-containing protein [Myxosarcina sp. GI1]